MWAYSPKIDPNRCRPAINRKPHMQIPKPSTPPISPVTLEYALEQLLLQAQHARLGTETLPLLHAAGRIVARPLFSAIAVPAFRNSAMDGYAYCAEDVGAAGVVLPVRQRIVAGGPALPLERMTLARIFTGAPVPSGADTVVPQEDTTVVNECEGGVRIDKPAQPFSHIRHPGEDIAHGACVLAAGERLQAAHLGLAASVGAAQLTVFRRPRVAILNSGDELVQPGSIAPADLPLGAVFNSSQFFLHPLLQAWGATIGHCGTLSDDLAATKQTLHTLAQTHDVILTSGGVSVGDEDHVRHAVAEIGHTTLWKIAMKPGKPFLCGLLPQTAQPEPDSGAGYCHVLGLPGNPVSSIVTSALLVRPFLLALQGAHVAALAWPSRAVRAGFAMRADTRRNFVRVRLATADDGSATLAAYPSQSSGVLTSVAWASGLADIPPNTAVALGDDLRYLDFAQTQLRC